jgi:hypothetical protein
MKRLVSQFAWLLGCVLVILTTGPSCRDQNVSGASPPPSIQSPTKTTGVGSPPQTHVDRTAPPAREPGPARPETAQMLEKTRKEVGQWLASFRESGLAPREISSLADIRGYRLYRRRYFRQAQVWFDAAVNADSTFEVPLYNAARAAGLNGDRRRARELLRKLAALNTPLAKRRMAFAVTDPDLGWLRPLH